MFGLEVEGMDQTISNGHSSDQSSSNGHEENSQSEREESILGKRRNGSPDSFCDPHVRPCKFKVVNQLYIVIDLFFFKWRIGIKIFSWHIRSKNRFDNHIILTSI